MKREKRRTQWQHGLGMVVILVAAVLLGGRVGVVGANLIHRGSEQTASVDGEDRRAQTSQADGEDVRVQADAGTGSIKSALTDVGDGGMQNALVDVGDKSMQTSPTDTGGGSMPVSADSVIVSQEPIEEALVPQGGSVVGEGVLYEAHATADTVGFGEEIISRYGILIDVESGNILAAREAYERMNPASMTKILTVLVAAEHLTEADLNETATITIDITDYCYINDCSITGYDQDETVTVRDLFYGTILPSGADSALALAIYVAGSQEAFVELMNEKLEALGLGETSHFMNCIGLYDEEHYSTAYDMAMILKAASDNAFCREVLAAHTYTTSQTAQHPEGLLISNWFLRRIEDRDTHGEVLCGKTGYVDQSGNCAASLSRGHDGREYLCVTAGSSSSWKCIADQVELYERFLPES